MDRLATCVSTDSNLTLALSQNKGVLSLGQASFVGMLVRQQPATPVKSCICCHRIVHSKHLQASLVLQQPATLFDDTGSQLSSYCGPGTIWWEGLTPACWVGPPVAARPQLLAVCLGLV